MPQSNSTSLEKLPCLAGVIAVVGCDGTGKSTLSADLFIKLNEKTITKRRYLGLVSGEAGEKIKSLPFVGVKLESYLARKASRAQDMKKKLPSTWTSIVMYVLSLYRAIQLRRVMRLSRRGIWVIADRYPQAEIPGFHYDGPGLTADRTNNWLITKLAARELKLYQWMAKQRPELIIRLNIDAETAYSRKPDHAIEELRDKISIMPKLNFNDAQILDIDTRAPYPEVLKAALAGIDQYCS
ncbi:MAG: hypothetical protein L3J46_03795 [Kangiellaceae bacterium]|nr:hypothetical protein [Kangiellaceae bacterium]